MYLINVFTGALEHFTGDAVPPYAILSHTWENDELNFIDLPLEDQHISRPDPLPDNKTRRNMFSAAHRPHVRNKAGYFKLTMSCEQAYSDGIYFVWVDTCCVDKRSSTELSESINSMFKWYGSAKICYAYLQDVVDSRAASIMDSRWFTRGWTLQELIAPRELQVFGQEWNNIGDKSALKVYLQQATGVDQSILTHHSPLSAVPIAQRMSWASKRLTTRVEDMAYCLLGIFDVNMPLLYGEGNKAFTRLQEEIIKVSDDPSIFAWGLDMDTSNCSPDRFAEECLEARPISMLAPSPKCFQNSNGVTRITDLSSSSSYTVTNLGLSISLPICRKVFGAAEYILGILPCRTRSSPWFECLAVLLVQEATSLKFRRVALNDGQSCISFDVRGTYYPQKIIISNEGDLHTWGSHYDVLWHIDHRAIQDRDLKLVKINGFTDKSGIDVSKTTHTLTADWETIGTGQYKKMRFAFSRSDLESYFNVECHVVDGEPQAYINVTRQHVAEVQGAATKSRETVNHIHGWDTRQSARTSGVLPIKRKHTTADKPTGQRRVLHQDMEFEWFRFSVECRKEKIMGQTVQLLHFVDLGSSEDVITLVPRTG